MDKNEFLSQLRQSLSGEVSADVIEQNIRYYDQYIPSGEEADSVLGELGDPRLIAKTIIESEKIARQKGNHSGAYSGGYESSYNYQSDDDDPDWEQRWEQENSGAQGVFFTKLKWQHKLVLAVAGIVLLMVLIMLSKFIIAFMFSVGFPLILIILVMILFRKRR